MLEASGGTGNQLFQYAATYSFAQATNSKFYLIIDPEYNKPNISPSDRNSILEEFGTPKENILHKDIVISTLLKFLRSSHINRLLLRATIVSEDNFMSLKNDAQIRIFLLDSGFESEAFFAEYKDEIRKIFDLDKIHLVKSISENKEKNASLNQIKSQLSEENSVCIHVRRRDFDERYHLSIEYQKSAMELTKKLLPNPQFYIFSDDIERVKDELGTGDNITYVSRPDSLPMEDFYLLSKCANNINANSTFSWWSSYLNKNYNRLVIHPLPTYKNSLLNERIENKHNFYAWKSLGYSSGTYPKNWVLLNYKLPSLNEFSKNLISEEKHREIFTNYKAPIFNIYSADRAQLDICDNKQSDFHTNLCFLNGKDAAKPTVVTAYYKVPNKHGHDNYIKWASNFLNIPFNLVVFTDKENGDWIKKMRKDLPLVLIEKEQEEFYHRKFLKTYIRDYENDNNKSRSPGLYMIWAEKVKFINEAIDKNPYNSEYFVWCDIGTFREPEYVGNNFVSTKFFPKGKISFAMIEEFSLKEIAERMMAKDAIRVGGNIQLGEIAAWRVYNEIWDKTRDEMMEEGIGTENDQRVMAAIALRYPELIELQYVPLNYNGNHWWYMLDKYKN